VYLKPRKHVCITDEEDYADGTEKTDTTEFSARIRGIH